MFGLGFGELLVILIVVLVVFGAGKLPEVGSKLGEAMKNFRKSMQDRDDKNNGSRGKS